MNENNDNKQNEPPKQDIQSSIETKSTSFRDKLAMFKQKAEKPTNPPPFKRASFSKPIETSSKITMALQKAEQKQNEEQPAKENISRIDIQRKSQNFSALQENIMLHLSKTIGGETFKPFGIKKEESKPAIETIKEEPKQDTDKDNTIKEEKTIEKNTKEVNKEPPKPIEMKNGIPIPPDMKNMNIKEKEDIVIERSQTFNPSLKNESLPSSHISGSPQEESLSSIRTAASINTSGVNLNTSQPLQTPKVANETFLEGIEIPENVINESFCEGFFITSFPANNGKVIENSDDYEATCGHKVCSSLPAMQPEIIYRYPQKDTKSLELNNLAASICFPSGIKICYEEENPVETVKNYSSSITNQQGDRYYMVTYHFFYKILNGQFVTKYSMYPIKYQTMKFCNDFYETIENDNELQEQISKKLEEYGELNFREAVYVPFCISLISKYPYFNQMEKCLESIRIMLANYNAKSKEINDLIH